MDELLSKYGGVSYYKYSDYKLIRNCAFGSRTEAFLDSDNDGIYDVHEQEGIALPSGKIIYSGNLMNDDPEMAMLSAVGLIPGGGDAVKAIGKFASFVARHALETAISAEALIQISKHSDELAKIIGHSDEAKQLKLAIANGANDNITRPMVDKINDIVDSADKIEFKPKATLMDDVVENGNDGFKAPKVFRDSNGNITNGKYVINDTKMLPHKDGTIGKSQFFSDVDAEKAVLDAAAFADQYDLWITNTGNVKDFACKAKVYVGNGPVGVTGKGEYAYYVNIYRTVTGQIHGCPGN